MESDVQMIDLNIVVPIGVSSPGTPIPIYFVKCIESLKEQDTSYKVKLTIAADDNVHEDIPKWAIDHGCNVSFYEPYSFMRRGSIWKKIHNEWNKVDSKYIAFCHYDDFWSSNKVESQLSLMEKYEYGITWSKVRITDPTGFPISQDMSIHNILTKDTLYQPTHTFCHASILNKEKFLATGIGKLVDDSACVYEDLQYILSHKLEGMKVPESTFFHREHGNSVRAQFCSEKDFMKEQRIIANYSMKDGEDDAAKIDLHHLRERVRYEL